MIGVEGISQSDEPTGAHSTNTKWSRSLVKKSKVATGLLVYNHVAYEKFGAKNQQT